MKKFCGALLGVLPVVVRDLAGIGGVALVTLGAWQIYPPAGFIVAGLSLVAAAWLLAKADN
jgi:glucose dehydrogenase